MSLRPSLVFLASSATGARASSFLTCQELLRVRAVVVGWHAEPPTHALCQYCSVFLLDGLFSCCMLCFLVVCSGFATNYQCSNALAVELHCSST